MKYKILRTDKAEDQLRDIIFYIAEDSGSVDIAFDYLDKIEKAIRQPEKSSNVGVKPRYSILRKQGYLVLIVERHLVFYKVDEQKKQIMIYSIIDSRREYEKLI